MLEPNEKHTWPLDASNLRVIFVTADDRMLELETVSLENAVTETNRIGVPRVNAVETIIERYIAFALQPGRAKKQQPESIDWNTFDTELSVDRQTWRKTAADTRVPDTLNNLSPSQRNSDIRRGFCSIGRCDETFARSD